MQIHDLKPKRTGPRAKRVGRGGSRGKTSGRGHKGQKARAGTGIRPAVRDIIKSVPKLRGHLFKGRKITFTILNLSEIDKNFAAGETVSRETLVEKRLVKKNDRKAIKILGNGGITKKINVDGCIFSASAGEKIKKAGGSLPKQEKS